MQDSRPSHRHLLQLGCSERLCQFWTAQDHTANVRPMVGGSQTMNGAKRFSGQRREAAPINPAVITAAEREVTICNAKLSEHARGHPSVKVWRARLAAARKVLDGKA